MPMQKRMYVLVRKELDATYRSVQGAHALALFSKEFPAEFKEWNNEYLIFLGVRFESGINEWCQRLGPLARHSTFFEPDLGQNTAIACYCDTKIFKDLPLA